LYKRHFPFAIHVHRIPHLQPITASVLLKDLCEVGVTQLVVRKLDLLDFNKYLAVTAAAAIVHFEAIVEPVPKHTAGVINHINASNSKNGRKKCWEQVKHSFFHFSF
jgi:hypothetical protein